MNRMIFLISLFTVLLVFTACDTASGGETPSGEDPGTALTDAEAVAQAKSNLYFVFPAGESSASVIQSLSLPLTAPNGVTLSWASSDTDLLDAEGNVTRPSFSDGDGQVTLTVTISKNAESDTKEFPITIKAAPPSFIVDNDWTDLGGIKRTRWVVAAGDNIYAGTINSGVVYSTDGGLNWDTISGSDLPSDQITKLALYGDKVLIGTIEGLAVLDTVTMNTTTVLTGKVKDIEVHGSKVYTAIQKVDNDEAIYFGDGPADLNTSILPSIHLISDLFFENDTLYVAGATNNSDDPEILVYNLPLTQNAHNDSMDMFTGGVSGFTGPLYKSGNIVVGTFDYCFYISEDSGASFTQNLETGGGTICSIDEVDSLLLCAKLGGDLWYSTNTGIQWDSTEIPGYDDFVGIVAQGMYIDNTTVYIAHEYGLLQGHLE